MADLAVLAARLRTCPFQEDQLKAFQRDFRPHMAPADLRTCPFAAPPLEVYRAKVRSDFESRGGILTDGLRLDEWV